MSEISNLGYVVIEASNLTAWSTFATDIIGASVDHGAAGQLGLRLDEHPWRVQIVSGKRDDISAAGWEFSSAEELEIFVGELRSKGGAVDSLDPVLRSVTRLYAMADPTGFTHEFYYGRTGIDHTSPMVSEVIRGDGFVTGNLGVGHIVAVVPDYEAAVDWYSSVLKLRKSDRIVEEVMPGVTVDVAFFHTQTGRHHSLATAEASSTKILNHLMLEYTLMRKKCRRISKKSARHC